MNPLEVGSQYHIKHKRKGVFLAEVVKEDPEWVTVKITKGNALYLSQENRAMGRGRIGDTITIRKSFCDFQKIHKIKEDP